MPDDSPEDEYCNISHLPRFTGHINLLLILFQFVGNNTGKLICNLTEAIKIRNLNLAISL
jgi:hypothetical protein